MITTDILVIGGGIAGLSFVAKAAKWFPMHQITLLTKDTCIESNTRYAQGGIAIALDSTGDSYERHIEDTMIAGGGLSNPSVVEKVVKEGPSRLIELLEWGVQFDRDATGQLALGREGGHTAHRIIHYKDATGFQIAHALINHISTLSNVEVCDHYFAIDLITRRESHGKAVCKGVVAMDLKNGIASTFSARVVILATGGAGQVYATTTNPMIATGDGIAMAFRAGAMMRDMEFIQFHPTAFYSKTDNPSFLISEAVRGFGAYLLNSRGERFVFDHDVRGELASRDVISKAIHYEINHLGDQCVFLDCRHLDACDLIAHFPTIYEQCLLKGIDITKDLIPVAPAAHYVCGGAVVDTSGRTSIPNLYACGECSCTGLHGANRLASNSLLEALVYAHEIFLDLEKVLPDIPPAETIEYLNKCPKPSGQEQWVAQMRLKIREQMSREAAIVRTYDGLNDLLQFIKETRESIANRFGDNPLDVGLCELRNMVDVALLIAQHSLLRKENRGTYYNSDLLVHA